LPSGAFPFSDPRGIVVLVSNGPLAIINSTEIICGYWSDSKQFPTLILYLLDSSVYNDSIINVKIELHKVLAKIT